MGKKAEAALEIMQSGGCFWVSYGKGFHDQPILSYTLLDKDGRRIKGFGIQTMRELEPKLDKKQDEFGFDLGCYRLAQ